MDHRNFSSSLQAVDVQEKRGSDLLHAVRRPPSKPWKKPASAQSLSRIYVVDPHGFRSLVQKLTGAPDFSSKRLREVAPPPLNIMSSHEPSPTSSKSECKSNSPRSTPTSFEFTSAANSIGVLSPSSYFSLCSFPLLSPGTMASLEASTVL